MLCGRAEFSFGVEFIFWAEASVPGPDRTEAPPKTFTGRAAPAQVLQAPTRRDTKTHPSPARRPRIHGKLVSVHLLSNFYSLIASKGQSNGPKQSQSMEHLWRPFAGRRSPWDPTPLRRLYSADALISSRIGARYRSTHDTLNI